MPGLTSLAIAESDERVAEALRYGFEREGVSVEFASDAASVAARAGSVEDATRGVAGGAAGGSAASPTVAAR